MSALSQLADLRAGYARTPEYCAAWQEAEAFEAEYAFLLACWKNGLGDDEGLPAAKKRWSAAVATIPPHLVPANYEYKLGQIESTRLIEKALSRTWADLEAAAKMMSDRGMRIAPHVSMDYIDMWKGSNLPERDPPPRKTIATPLKMRQQPSSLIYYSMEANPLRFSETYGKTYVDDSGT